MAHIMVCVKILFLVVIPGNCFGLTLELENDRLLRSIEIEHKFNAVEFPVRNAVILQPEYIIVKKIVAQSPNCQEEMIKEPERHCLLLAERIWVSSPFINFSNKARGT